MHFGRQLIALGAIAGLAIIVPAVSANPMPLAALSPRSEQARDGHDHAAADDHGVGNMTIPMRVIMTLYPMMNTTKPSDETQPQIADWMRKTWGPHLSQGDSDAVDNVARAMTLSVKWLTTAFSGAMADLCPRAGSQWGVKLAGLGACIGDGSPTNPAEKDDDDSDFTIFDAVKWVYQHLGQGDMDGKDWLQDMTIESIVLGVAKADIASADKDGDGNKEDEDEKEPHSIW